MTVSSKQIIIIITNLLVELRGTNDNILNFNTDFSMFFPRLARHVPCNSMIFRSGYELLCGQFRQSC